MRNTPAQAGFHMPAEWEEHEGTWLQWPHDGTHPGYQMRLEHIWLRMTEVLHQREAVHRRCSQDFHGQIVKQAAGDEEELVVCSVDLACVEMVRGSFSFPFRDRRIDSYGGLTKLYLD